MLRLPLTPGYDSVLTLPPTPVPAACGKDAVAIHCSRNCSLILHKGREACRERCTRLVEMRDTSKRGKKSVGISVSTDGSDLL